MAVDREFRVRFSGDASQLNAASKEGAAGLEKVGAATEESGKASEKATFSHKDMHRALHEIGEKAPEVGTALNAMSRGPAAGLVILISLIRSTQEGIANLQKSLSTSDWDSFSSLIDGAKKSLEGAKLEASAFAREMEHAAKATQTATEKASELAKIHAAESSAMDKVRDAQKKFELAEADQITDKEEKEKRKATIELRYAADKKRREDEDAKFKINEEYRLLANEDNFQTRNAAKLEAARQHAQGLGSEEEVNKKIEIEQARLKKTEDEIAEKQKRHDELADKPWLRRSTPEEKEKDYLAQQLQQLSSIQSGQQALLRKMEQRRPGQINAIRTAGEEVKGLESDQLASATRSHKLREGLPGDERIAGIESAARNQVFMTDLASGAAGGRVGIGEAAQAMHAAGLSQGNLTKDMSNLIQVLMQFARTNDNADLRAQIKALITEVNQINERAKQARINHGAG